MVQVVRETFEERYNKYLKDPISSLKWMLNRLVYVDWDAVDTGKTIINKEELAYLLATHDMFIHRIGCAEYASDDDPSWTMRYTDEKGDIVEKHHEGAERLKDPLGREVDSYGKLINKKTKEVI